MMVVQSLKSGFYGWEGQARLSIPGSRPTHILGEGWPSTGQPLNPGRLGSFQAEDHKQSVPESISWE